ncbi:MAG TPA: DUF1289 domain-containing protein, partial [Colwellia sp.]|nr:DUF1289 domain-containing protein [Colwellia sp.]
MSNHKSKNQTKLTDSPCIRNCCLDDDDFCLGCFRRIDEIIAWRNYSNEQKQQVT